MNEPIAMNDFAVNGEWFIHTPLQMIIHTTITIRHMESETNKAMYSLLLFLPHSDLLGYEGG